MPFTERKREAAKSANLPAGLPAVGGQAGEAQSILRMPGLCDLCAMLRVFFVV